jgi:hypothetical protein
LRPFGRDWNPGYVKMMVFTFPFDNCNYQTFK